MKPNPVIIALDVESAEQAWRLVERLGDRAGFYKVGLELYSAAGMDFVRQLMDRGKQVFLDLKFYDIGETVKRAVARVAASGVSMLTVHAQGAVMRAAVEGKGGSALKILGVTVLTSFDQSDLEADGYTDLTVPDLVLRRVRNAVAAGIDGIVCSPLELRPVRSIAGPGMVLVTPGVRSEGAALGDQKRVATPREAVRNGADYLVIGREVTRADDPEARLASILDHLATESLPVH